MTRKAENGRSGARRALAVVGIVVKVVLCAAAAILLVYNVYVMIARMAGNGMPKVFGTAFASVTTGSMSPEINAGDFIVVRGQDDYEKGDVITFFDERSGVYVTHRIVEKRADGSGFVTKGDANSSPDPYIVASDDIVGEVVAVARGLGSFVTFVQSPVGTVTAVAVIALIWAASVYIPKIVRAVKDKKTVADEDQGSKSEKEQGCESETDSEKKD